MTRKHNRLSSTPHLSIYKTPNGELLIENTGTGLAILEELSFKIKKREFDATDPDYWRKLKSIKEFHAKGKITTYYFNSGTRIQAGTSYPIIAWSDDADDGSDLLHEFTKNAKFHIVYSSMYGEEFQYGEH